MKIRNLLFPIILIATIFGGTYVHADDLSKDIFISNAWVQAMPPSQKITAAYMVITNNSSKEAVVVAASSDIAGITEIHQMSTMNGMMHMAMIGNVDVPAQEKVSLQPDGFHIMLIDLKKPVNKGDIVPITLHFKDGGSIMVNAEVKAQE